MDLELNAARRNLILTSVGFIVYSFGKGEINPQISMSIGLTLNAPSILTVGAWIALFWFFYRYRIYSGSAWDFTMRKFFESLNTREIKGQIVALPEVRVKVDEFDADTEIVSASLHRVSTGTDGSSYFKWDLTFNIQETVVSNGNSTTSHNSRSFELGIKVQRLFKYKKILHFIINNKEFSDLVFPFILFGFALFTGIGLFFRPDLNAWEFFGMIASGFRFALTHL